jgi:hypothetical protein
VEDACAHLQAGIVTSFRGGFQQSV